MPGIRKYRRDTTEVSCCLKYVIFGVNILFWVSKNKKRVNLSSTFDLLNTRFYVDL